MADIQPAFEGKPLVDPKEKVPERYHQYLNVFSEKHASQLLQHYSYNLKINLKEGTTPPFSPLYSMSRDELLVLEKGLKIDLE